MILNYYEKRMIDTKQVKTFFEYFGEGDIDSAVNNWIKENNIDVVDMRHSVGLHDIHTIEFITVTYKEVII